jgi:hypothetical protein
MHSCSTPICSRRNKLKTCCWLLVDGSHVSITDTGVLGMAISTAAITAITGVSGLPQGVIASAETEP